MSASRFGANRRFLAPRDSRDSRFEQPCPPACGLADEASQRSLVRTPTSTPGGHNSLAVPMKPRAQYARQFVHDDVWMHAATRRCEYPADSSILVAGAAGAATSTHSLLRRRSDRDLRLTPGPVPAGNLDGTCLRYATYPHLAGPRGRPPTVSARATCDVPSLPPDRDSLLQSPGRGARRPQCADCDGCAYLRLAFPLCVTVFGAARPQCRPRVNSA